MSYIVWSDVVGRYKKLGESFDESEAQGLIDGAQGEIDARLASRYTVPFTPVPGIIKDLCIDMAYYRTVVAQEMEKPLGAFIERRLASLAAGSSSLVVSGSLLTPIDTRAWSERDGIRSVFGPDDPTNWSVSQDWQNAAQDERSND